MSVEILHPLVIQVHFSIFVADTNEIETNNQQHILKSLYMGFFEVIALLPFALVNFYHALINTGNSGRKWR